MTRAVVLQHISCEPPGIYETVLDEHDIDILRVEIDEGDPLPDWREADLVVAMGGPMSVNDEAALAWLAEEKSWMPLLPRRASPISVSASGRSCSPPALEAASARETHQRSGCSRSG